MYVQHRQGIACPRSKSASTTRYYEVLRYFRTNVPNVLSDLGEFRTSYRCLASTGSPNGSRDEDIHGDDHLYVTCHLECSYQELTVVVYSSNRCAKHCYGSLVVSVTNFAPYPTSGALLTSHSDAGERKHVIRCGPCKVQQREYFCGFRR